MTKWFNVLVVQGALLTACDADVAEEGPRSDDDDDDAVEKTTGDDDDDDDDDDSAESAATSDTNDSGADCGDAVCLNTDSWTECTSDGVLCCWAFDVCCDLCCGHLSP